MKKLCITLSALLLFSAALAAPSAINKYTVNDRALTDMSIEELYDLHGSLVDALEEIVESEHKSTSPDKWTWVVNEKTNKFHYPYCLSALEITGGLSFVRCSSEELIDKGYKPCGRCEPPQ